MSSNAVLRTRYSKTRFEIFQRLKTEMYGVSFVAGYILILIFFFLFSVCFFHFGSKRELRSWFDAVLLYMVRIGRILAYMICSSTNDFKESIHVRKTRIKIQKYTYTHLVDEQQR